VGLLDSGLELWVCVSYGEGTLTDDKGDVVGLQCDGGCLWMRWGGNAGGRGGIDTRWATEEVKLKEVETEPSVGQVRCKSDLVEEVQRATNLLYL
jgi:hypothetical protein